MTPPPDPAKLKQAGLLTAIPFVLLAGPALGYWLGSIVDRRWSTAPWGIAVGTVFGFVASAQVTVDFIRQANRFNKE